MNEDSENGITITDLILSAWQQVVAVDDLQQAYAKEDMRKLGSATLLLSGVELVVATARHCLGRKFEGWFPCKQSKVSINSGSMGLSGQLTTLGVLTDIALAEESKKQLQRLQTQGSEDWDPNIWDVGIVRVPKEHHADFIAPEQPLMRFDCGSNPTVGEKYLIGGFLSTRNDDGKIKHDPQLLGGCAVTVYPGYTIIKADDEIRDNQKYASLSGSPCVSVDGQFAGLLTHTIASTNEFVIANYSTLQLALQICRDQSVETSFVVIRSAAT